MLNILLEKYFQADIRGLGNLVEQKLPLRLNKRFGNEEKENLKNKSEYGRAKIVCRPYEGNNSW